MPTLSLRPDEKELILWLDKAVKEGTIPYEFDCIPDGDELIGWRNSDRDVLNAFDEANVSVAYSKLQKLARRNLITITWVTGEVYKFEIEQALHDLVERNFEVASQNPIVNVTGNGIAVNISRADAVNIIQDNQQLADTLEAKLQNMISSEHAFISEAINELREAVDASSKQTSIQKIFAAAARTGDVYTMLQIAVGIAEFIARR